MTRKHSPRLLLKRTRAGEAIESPPFPSGGGNRGSESRGWKTAGGLGLLALLDPIAAPPGDPQQMPETAVRHWLPGLPLPLVSEAGRALLPSRPRSPQCPRGKCFSSHEVGLGKGGVAFQGCPHVAAHGPGAGGTEGKTGRMGPPSGCPGDSWHRVNARCTRGRADGLRLPPLGAEKQLDSPEGPGPRGAEPAPRLGSTPCRPSVLGLL